MAREISEIVRDIETFTPTNGYWRPLDDLFAELWQHEFPTDVIPALFRVFERFPDDDGAGVLWTILHGLEVRDDYEDALRQSMARKPSRMGKVMLDRLERWQKQN
jgi:hypothetical protein